MLRVVLAWLFAVAVVGMTRAADVPRPVRVLLVTGVDHPAHNWKATAPALKRLLEQDGRCTVRIVEDPDVLATDLVFQHDVVLLHFRNEQPLAHEAQARENLTRLVREGKGLVLIHFACGAFGDWPGFGDLAGMVWDGKNTHDPRGPFLVKSTYSDHPITKEMSEYLTDDELYIGLAQRRPVDILAVARSRVTEREHPMAFAFTSGKGRVFHTPLGHDVKALQIPGTAALIRRGCLWAAGVDLTPSGRTHGSLDFMDKSTASDARPIQYWSPKDKAVHAVCLYTYDPGKIKPYVSELAPIFGENVLRDSPLDHKHHHGLMFAMKVNGINFWEEAPGCGYQKHVPGSERFSTVPGDAPQRATISHRLHWVAGPDAALSDTGRAALLIEDRTLTVMVDESTGESAVRWHSAFQVGPRAAEVELGGANYHGLGMRFREDLDPLASFWIVGTQPDLSGTRQDVRTGSWAAVTFKTPGKPATVAIFGSPGNPGGEAHFFSMRRPFAYLSATPGLDTKPLRYKAGERFTFDYLVTVYPVIKSPEFLAKRAETWLKAIHQNIP
jgi:type 1 glutamine amidotransferase